MGVGDDIDQGMWEAIEDADRCIAICSPAYFDRSAVYSQAERGTYWWQGLKGLRASIIPVIAKHGGMPKVLDAKAYHDLTKETVQSLVEKWRGHPLHGRRTAFLNRQRLARPVRGRETELDQLKAALAQTSHAAIQTVVQGAGGIGKTTLARYYVHQYFRDYDGVIWCNAETRTALITDLYRLYTVLKDDLPPNEQTENGAANLLDLMGRREQKWLYIFDNLPSLDVMDGLLPQGDLIVTTRDATPFAGFTSVATDVLPYESPDSAAVVVLMDAADREDDAEAAQLVAEELGGLPLALVMAGTVAKEDALSFADLLTQLRRVITQKPEGQDYKDSVAKAVMLSVGRVSADARAMLDCLAWMAPEGISDALFARAVAKENWAGVRGRLPEALCAVVEDAGRRAQALREARRWSILMGDGPFDMHRLTQLVLRQEAEGQARGFEAAKGAAAILAAGTPGNPGLAVNWPAWRVFLPQVQALWEVAEPLWRGAWAQADWDDMDFLLNAAGVFLGRQEDHVSAVVIKRASLEMKQARLGEEHRDVPLAMGNLALDLVHTGELAEAQELVAKAVRLDEVHRKGDARTDLAVRYLQQASVAMEAMRAGQAKAGQVADAALEKAEQIRTELFGAQSDEVALVWSSRGVLRGLQGRREEQWEAAKTAYNIRVALPGVDKASMAATTMNLGANALRLGRCEEAERFLRRAHKVELVLYQSKMQPSLQQTTAWLVSCLLTLARKGDKAAAREAEARELCAQHGLDFEQIATRAADFPLSPPADAPPAT